MASSPLAELSSSKAASQSDELRLFPLKSGPNFAGGGLANGASGILFTGTTLDARADNDPFACCGSYTLRNSIHAAVAAVTNDQCTLFALKSVVGQRACLAVGAFDADGKPRQVTNDEFRKITLPLNDSSGKLSLLLTQDPTKDPVVGGNMRSGNSSYGFKTKMTTSKHVFVLNNPDGGHINFSDPHYIIDYENHVGSQYDSFERSHNLSVEHDGHQVSNINLGGRLRQDAREIAASISQSPTSRSFNVEAKNGDLSTSLGKTYADKVRTDRFGLGYGQTNYSQERSTDGKRTDKIAHRINKFTVEVVRTRDRQNGIHHSLEFKIDIPIH